MLLCEQFGSENMKTKWSLSELARFRGEALTLSGTMDIEEDLKKRNKHIYTISPVTFVGTLDVEQDEYILFVNFDFTIVLPSSRTLKPTEVHLNLPVSEIYVPKDLPEDISIGEVDEDAVVIELLHDWIDLEEVAVDNILAAIPLRVLSEEEKSEEHLPKGTGWTVLTEEQAQTNKNEEKEQGDPRFDALKSLFPDDKE